ncbi:MAG: RsmD family RNA methyltransferase [Flavobacteriales bacterium]|nr:RsmD family RNA methyltransferase [Flavobacteriales bacterium]
MRIISGKHKGRILSAPKNLPVRPTTDMAKEALFNILENRYFLDRKKVLDLFSGIGSIAFEFASRGSKNITAIDQNFHCTKFIIQTAENLDYNINVKKMDCLDFLQNTKQNFDIIFADPPYNFEHHKKLKDIIFSNNLVRKDGCLIIEHDSNTNFNDKNVELRKYGSVHFSIFTN